MTRNRQTVFLLLAAILGANIIARLLLVSSGLPEMFAFLLVIPVLFFWVRSWQLRRLVRE